MKLLGTLFLLSASIVSGNDSTNLRGRDLLLSEPIAVAHLGNSMQYKNDLPRLLESMMQERYANYQQNSCLHPGTNVTSLWKEGNGMKGIFNTTAARKDDGSYDIGAASVKELLEERQWDYVVINDYSQAPCRDHTKDIGKKTLKDKYLPNIKKDTTVVFLMTPAYKQPVKGSDDLGSFDQFTGKLLKGYREYADIFPNSVVAPVGLAFKHIRDRYGDEEWSKLYAPDHFHPSPFGTYLEALVLYSTINGYDNVPPMYDEDWWNEARVKAEPQKFPNDEEAERLRQAAIDTCAKFFTDDDDADYDDILPGNPNEDDDDEDSESSDEDDDDDWTEDTLTSMLVVVGASTLSLGLVFVIFKVYKRATQKKRQTTEEKVIDLQTEENLQSLPEIS